MSNQMECEGKAEKSYGLVRCSTEEEASSGAAKLCTFEDEASANTAQEDMPSHSFTVEEVRSALPKLPKRKRKSSKQKKARKEMPVIIGTVKSLDSMEGEATSGSTARHKLYTSKEEASQKDMPTDHSTVEEVGSAVPKLRKKKRKSTIRDLLKSKQESARKENPRIIGTIKSLEKFVNPEYYKYTDKEIRDLWYEKCAVPSRKPIAREDSRIALEYYNEKNLTDFVLVEGVSWNYIHVFRGYTVYHVNFKAKRPNDDDKDAVLFYAELDGHSPSNVSVCTILDATSDIQTYCKGCGPSDKIQHVVGSFHPHCQGPYIRRKLNVSTFVSMYELSLHERNLCPCAQARAQMTA